LSQAFRTQTFFAMSLGRPQDIYSDPNERPPVPHAKSAAARASSPSYLGSGGRAQLLADNPPALVADAWKRFLQEQELQANVNSDNNLRLVLQNTFLEVIEIPLATMQRSRSDSEISSSSGSAPLVDCDGHPSSSGASDKRFIVYESRSSDSNPFPSNQNLQPGMASTVETPCYSQPPNSHLPSRGSGEHDAGACHPCCFFFRDQCQLGFDCNHCHYAHEPRKRPGKKARARERGRLGRAAASSSICASEGDEGTDGYGSSVPLSKLSL